MAGLLYAPMNSCLIHTFRKNIRKEDISPIVPEYCPDGIEWNSHCTLYYGIEGKDGSEVKPTELVRIVDFLQCFVADYPELVFVPHQCEVFEEKNWDCIVVMAANRILHILNRDFQAHFGYKGSDMPFAPHITIGYVKKGLGRTYANKFNTKFAGHKVMRVDEIVIEFEDGTKHSIRI